MDNFEYHEKIIRHLKDKTNKFLNIGKTFWVDVDKTIIASKYRVREGSEQDKTKSPISGRQGMAHNIKCQMAQWHQHLSKAEIK